MTADHPRGKESNMTVFTIDAENNITAFADTELAQAAAGASVQTFTSQKELAKLAADWPATRLVETWNGFAGVVPFDHLKPVKKFTDRNIAVKRIWQAIQKLALATQAAHSHRTRLHCVVSRKPLPLLSPSSRDARSGHRDQRREVAAPG
jgi:hypothetical protein